MPSDNENRGFFTRQLDNMFSLADRIRRIAAEQRSKEREAILQDARRLDMTVEQIKELSDPDIAIEQAKALYDINRYYIDRKLFGIVKSVDALNQQIRDIIGKREEQSNKSFIARCAEAAEDKLIMSMDEKEKNFRVRYEEKVRELPQDQRAKYAAVPEEVKLQFIDILSHSPTIKLNDLDANMTKEQARVISATARLYLKRAGKKYNKEDVLTGKLFRDKDTGKLPDAKTMLDMVNKDFRGLAVTVGENGRIVPNPHFKWWKYKKDIINLERLSLEITKQPNEMLAKLPLRDLNDMAFDWNHMLWKNAAKKEYMDLIEPQQKRLENAIDDILGERKPDELSMKEISNLAENIKKNNPEITFNKEYVEDFYRAVYVYGEDTFDPLMQEQYRKQNPVQNYDKDLIMRKAEVYFEMAESGAEENPFENEKYNFDGQTLEFKDGVIKITNNDKKEYTFKIEDLKEKTPDEKEKYLKNLAFVAINGCTEKEAFERYEKEKELDKEFEAKNIYNQKRDAHKRDSIENIIGAKEDVERLENALMNPKNPKDEKNAFKDIAIVLKNNTIQVRSIFEGKECSLKYDFRKGGEIKNNNFFKSDKINEGKINLLKKELDKFFKEWTPEKIDKGLEIGHSKEVSKYIQNNFSAQFDINKLKEGDPKFAKTIASIAPNAITIRTFDNGDIGIVTSNRAQKPEDLRYGMITFDKEGHFNIKGSDKNLNELKNNRKGQENEKINELKRSLIGAIGKELQRENAISKPKNKDDDFSK